LRSPGDDRLVAESALHDAVADALGGEAGQVELRTMPGPAGRNFVAAAREVNAQLIVLAGRGAASMLPGTTGQHVVQRAPCPVVIVPEAGMVR
jgi:nucleotide-binding universal stress UspA family protein